VNEWEEYSGRLEAIERVEIRSRIGGTIDEVLFDEGEIVKKGEPLFIIDPKPYQALYQAAKATADYSRSELERALKLLPQKAISKREFDEKKNAAEIANAALTKAQLDLGYTKIVSPISGRISRAEITVGNLISAGTQLLTTIVSIDPIYASFEVDEQNYVRYLHANGENPNKLANIPVKLALSGDVDFKYQGHVKSFDNELNTRSGTVRVRAVFPNKTGALIPGLYAKLKLSGTGKQNLILINERAIITDQDKKKVYVIGADNKAEAREVKLGAVVEGLRVIREGLKEGELIVVNGIQTVQYNMPFTPQIVSMDTLTSESKLEEKK
ncbi:MAG: efflux RND transporter periplasmic adaptor subunit, partial [Pseudomonadota bacterium]